MMIVFEANTVDELREQIATYLDVVEHRERKAALSERKQGDARSRIARAHLVQSLAMDIRKALLHQSEVTQ